MRNWVCLSGLAALSLSPAALAGQYVFPKEGQSEEQQREDEYYCHSWAISEIAGGDTSMP